MPTTHHAALLGDAPAFFDTTGSRLPSKYAPYISQQKYLLLYFFLRMRMPKVHGRADQMVFHQRRRHRRRNHPDRKKIAADDPKTWMQEKGMPWLALARDDVNHAGLTTKYGSPLLPTLVLLDENDEVVARSNEGEKNLETRVVLKKYLELTKVSKKK